VQHEFILADLLPWGITMTCPVSIISMIRLALASVAEKPQGLVPEDVAEPPQPRLLSSPAHRLKNRQDSISTLEMLLALNISQTVSLAQQTFTV